MAAVAGRAYAEGEGVFLNTDLGVSFVQGLPSGVHADPGMRFSLAPGYRIYNDETFAVSLQFETGVIWNHVNGGDFNQMTPQGGGNLNQMTPQGGFGGSPRTDLYQVPFMAGFEYSFHAGDLVVPYIGIAGGGVYTDWQSHWDTGQGQGSDGNGPGQRDSGITEHQSSVSGAVQGALGVRVKLSNHIELGVGYKFLACFPKDVDYLGTHSVSATFVWRF
jgi:hypothetical protein